MTRWEDLDGRARLRWFAVIAIEVVIVCLAAGWVAHWWLGDRAVWAAAVGVAIGGVLMVGSWALRPFMRMSYRVALLLVPAIVSIAVYALLIE